MIIILSVWPDPNPKQIIPDPDPRKSSGSDRIRIHNTEYLISLLLKLLKFSNMRIGTVFFVMLFPFSIYKSTRMFFLVDLALKCDICGKNFTTEAELTAHEIQHMKLTCGICHKVGIADEIIIFDVKCNTMLA